MKKLLLLIFPLLTLSGSTASENLNDSNRIHKLISEQIVIKQKIDTIIEAFRLRNNCKSVQFDPFGFLECKQEQPISQSLKGGESK